MEWIIGIYMGVGLLKALGRLAADSVDQPVWMRTQRNPIKWALSFLALVLVWPIARS